MAITSTPGARPDPEHKTSHKKHHTILSASCSCDGVNASRSRNPRSPFAALSPPVNVTRTPSVLATVLVKSPVKHRPDTCLITSTGAPYHRTRWVQRQHIGVKALTLKIAISPLNFVFCRPMYRYHRHQVHVRTKSTKQITQRTITSSQHHALVTVSMHRAIAPRAAFCRRSM